MVKPLVLATAAIPREQAQDAEHVRFPRVDYLELKRLVDVDILDYEVYDSVSGNWFRKLDTLLRSDLYLTFKGLLRSRRSSLVLAMSERVGIPYSGWRRVFPSRKPFLMMITSWSRRQEIAFAKLGLLNAADAIVLHSHSLRNHLIELGANPARVIVVPYGIDHQFFSPRPHSEARPGFVISIGESRTRDYPTLFRAVEGLPADVLVAASGSWYAREKNPADFAATPPNVTISRHIPAVGLRNLYAQAQFVVLPVRPSVASFGATATLEASAMGLPVIATRSPGLADYVVDGVTGILVEPGDTAGLRNAVIYLLANPEEARRMGRNARCRVEACFNIDRYSRELAALVKKYS
jgi:glycosyltransferase involved in cell wall biosynthesis